MMVHLCGCYAGDHTCPPSSYPSFHIWYTPQHQQESHNLHQLSEHLVQNHDSLHKHAGLPQLNDGGDAADLLLQGVEDPPHPPPIKEKSKDGGKQDRSYEKALQKEQEGSLSGVSIMYNKIIRVKKNPINQQIEKFGRIKKATDSIQ